MVNVVLRSTVAAIALMAGFSHIAAAAPITSNWTPGNVGNWSGGAAADAANWTHSSAPAATTFPRNFAGDTFTVNIDNGGGPASTVNLNVFATIDALNVSAGDTLNFNNNTTLTIAGGGVTNDGTLNLNSANNLTGITFAGSQTLTGTGDVVMGNNSANRVIVDSNNTVVTQAAGHTIRGAGQVLANAGGFVNNGAIRQQGTVALTLDPGSADVDGNGANFVNNGVLRSEGAGGLTLNNGIYQNNTAIETTGGGDIRLASTITEVRGGTLASSGGGTIRSVAGGGAIIDAVTLTSGSELRLNNDEDIRIRNGLTNNGTVSLNSGNNLTDALFLGSQTLTGTGEVVMGDNSANRLFVDSNNTVVTLDTQQTIRGAGQVLANAGGFVNNGAVIADSAVVAMRIDAGTNFSNQGTLRATGAAGFSIDGGAAFTQAGGLADIQAGSQISMTFGDYVQTGGHTQVDGALRIAQANRSVNIQGGTFGGTGLVDFANTGVNALNNTGGMITAGSSPGTLTIQDGNFVQGPGGTFEFELDGFVAGVGHDLLNIVNGDADLGGDLSIVADQLFASTLSIGDQFEVVRLDPLGTFLDGDLVNGADLFDNIIINLAGLNFTQLFIGNSLFIEVTQANVQPPGGDPIPEPESMILMMLGLTAMLWMRRRRVTIH